MRVHALMPLFLLHSFGTSTALAQAPKERVALPAYYGARGSLAFTPDGKLMAAYHQGSQGVEVMLWDVASGEEAGVHYGSAPFTFSPAGRTLACTWNYRDVRMWYLLTGKERGTLNKGERRHLGAVAFTPDAKVLATGTAPQTAEDGVVKLWDVVTGRELAAFKDHKGRVSYLGFTPDGKTLISHCDHGVRLRDVSSDKVRKRLAGAFLSCRADRRREDARDGRRRG